MKTPLLAFLALLLGATPGFAQQPCTKKPKPCTPEQKRAWDREVAQRDAVQMNALFAFVKSLDPARTARFNTPFVNVDNWGATGRGFRVSDLSDAQKSVFVKMLRDLDIPTAQAKTVTWTNAVAANELDSVHVRFCAMMSVTDKAARSDWAQIPLFDYGSGAAMPYSASPTPTPVVGRTHPPRPARDEYLRRATVLMKRKAYPADAPIPESAFLRETVVLWKNLSVPQQEWVKKSITTSMNLGEEFRWERCSVRMWRTVTFTGGYKASDNPGASSSFSNSYL